MAKIPAPAEGETFEELLKAAEDLAERMELGDMSLDESLAAYQKGIGNIRRCAELLQKAEEKVKLLLEDGQGFSLVDLDGGDEDDDGEGEGE